MKRIFLVLFLIPTFPASAGPFIGIGIGSSRTDIEAPSLLNLQPYTTQADDSGFLRALSLGWRGRNNWSITVTYGRLDGYNSSSDGHDVTGTGGVGDQRLIDRSERTVADKVVSITVAKAFPLANAIAAEANVGAVSWRRTTEDSKLYREYDIIAGPTGPTTGSVTLEQTSKTTAEDSDIDVTWGVALLIHDDTVTFRIGGQRYGGIATTVVLMGVEIAL